MNIMQKLILIMLAQLALFGCATKIKLEVDRPPNFYVADVKNITMNSFTGDSYAKEYVQSLNRYNLVNSQSEADAQLRGWASWNYLNTQQQKQLGKDKKGNVSYYTEYTTQVWVNVGYSLIRVSDGIVIGSRSMFGYDSQSMMFRPDADKMAMSIIRDKLGMITKDLAPYTVIEKRSFAKEKSEATVVKSEMDNALNLVKAKNYSAALDAYLSIYNQHKSIAAAENASILYEAFGKVQAAATLMQQALNETKNPRAQIVLDRLNSILHDKATIEDIDTEKQAKSGENP